MKKDEVLNYVKSVLENMPAGWVNKTTHRLDCYNENLAKVEFLTHFQGLFAEKNFNESSLEKLPTAFDYIRLGHPLSCLLEWVFAVLNDLEPANVISFSSRAMPLLSILRKNLLDNKETQVFYKDSLPEYFNSEVFQNIYGYKFNLKKINDISEILNFKGSTVFISNEEDFSNVDINLNSNIDFYVINNSFFGSLVLLNTNDSENYVSEIQHVRRRESIAMTPQNCLEILGRLVGNADSNNKLNIQEDMKNKELVLSSIKEITSSSTEALLGSCGLSIQYAILMGLIQTAREQHVGKEIKIIVPPNCYGGTNDQARRVAACIDDVEVVDLLVDGDNDMVQSVDMVLDKIAEVDAVSYIIAEIPTNPRVEVPDLEKLNKALTKERVTRNGAKAIDPVFILDQTFCPNINFLGDDEILSGVKTISYVSGSKFPSGGLCTAGYCIGNKAAKDLMPNIKMHLKICDNEATRFQIKTLSKQMPSMNKRIKDAYNNTREFVSFINENLSDAKINFVSDDLAEKGFTPSVFSLDLPTKGDNNEEREAYKRNLNYKLIDLMIKNIPDESKHCVSYGQLKGSYWTIPATSTQGTTKEGDKDYIVRVAMSPDLDLELHKKVFLDFVKLL